MFIFTKKTAKEVTPKKVTPSKEVEKLRQAATKADQNL